ncbi:MAG: DNA polymerase III subunit delta [Pseudomonadota bacterium]|nr:DNA polymerase III subunit delta [Pseudomonadota bacterium]MDP1903866.1 DNA polymerase III subunit delta [Pseudomonadota bacterium]MDP2353636.1 DNA polymerase III subunit delta [Pseudomonadota bacterium]
MKLRGEQLEAQLKRQLAPVWLVSGDEPLLTDEACARIRAVARAQGYDERQSYQSETGFDWKGWLAGFDSLSLFSSRRLIELRLPTGKPGIEGGKTLEAWVANPPADTLLLITTPKLDKATLSTKWATALERGGILLQTAPPPLERLPDWIGERLARHGLKADRDTLAWLAARVEGNLLAAHQEIEKLALLLPPGQMDREAVRGAVTDVARYDVSDLSESFLKGDAARFCRVLDGLRAEGEALVFVLAVFGGEVRTLYRLAAGLARGERLPALMQAARVWDSRQGLVERALQRADVGKWAWAMRGLSRLDRAAKGLLREDAWDELKQLGLALMNKGQAPAFEKN